MHRDRRSSSNNFKNNETFIQKKKPSLKIIIFYCIFFIIILGVGLKFIKQLFDSNKSLSRPPFFVENWDHIFHKSSMNLLDEKKLVSLLTPKSVNLDLMRRVGSKGDGGYVIPKQKYTHHICLGVGGDISFENQIRNDILGQIICFDHTVPQLPGNPHPSIKLYRKKVSDNDTITSVSVPTIIKQLNYKNNMSLKMDIEGWEFPVLSNLNPTYLKYFSLIVVELHCLGNKGDGGDGDSGPIKDPKIKLKCLEKLLLFHDLIHINPAANVSPLKLNLNYFFPYVVELTFVLKNSIQTNNVKYKYPTKLDTYISPRNRAAMDYLQLI